ncbi:MAG: hypothetical protein RIB98_01450 [Acidimicrobiales bacterium]
MRFRSLLIPVVVVALLAAACGDDGEASAPADAGDDAADVVIELEVVDGDLVGGSRQVDVGLGQSVEVVVSGDSTDQVHIHGYDLYVDLVDGEGSTSFDALIPGTFEIELEAAGRLLVRMTVS